MNWLEKYGKVLPFHNPKTHSICGPVRCSFPLFCRISVKSSQKTISVDDLSLAVSHIRDQRPGFQPDTALILGSGLGALADKIEDATVLPYRTVPGFPLSHVAGHAGNLVLGRIGTTAVAALAGRAHLYEGWPPQQATFPLRCLHALGCKTLIVSNASGGINPRFVSGQVVAIDNHIDRMQMSPFRAEEWQPDSLESGQLHRNSNPYDSPLIAQAQAIAIELGFALATGTYLATLGPTYETRAEYRMFAKLGADMVGMSTVPEVALANHLGMRTLAFSIVTNVAKPDAPTKTEHSEVLDWSQHAQSQLIPLIQRLLS
jgi:purine-nucleoside phosphorylase